jgi:hypothetical protein
MAADELKPRSRRALLAAAAGAAGALAANAAMPLTAAALDPDDVVLGIENYTGYTTGITNGTPDSNAFLTRATGRGIGVLGTSTGGGGVVGWSISPPGSWWTNEDAAYTGVFGSAPTDPRTGYLATGVWGDSPDIGVFGSGGYGVYGYGGVGVSGDANSLTGSIGVWAWAPTTAQVALKVTGKVSLSRSGRQTMTSGTSSRSVTLAGVTSSSKVFAVLATGEPGRWVRSVIPYSGKFTIYLNTKLASSAVVSWFVLD